MKTFIVCMLISFLMIGAYAEYSQRTQLDSMVDMGLMYAQNTLNFDGQCLKYAKQAYDVAIKLYNVITNGETDDLFGIIMQVIPLINNIKEHCF